MNYFWICFLLHCIISPLNKTQYEHHEYRFSDNSSDQTEPEIKFINIQDRLRAGMYQCYVYQKGGDIRDAMLSAPALLMIEVPAVNENIEYNRKFTRAF